MGRNKKIKAKIKGLVIVYNEHLLDIKTELHGAQNMELIWYWRKKAARYKSQIEKLEKRLRRGK